MTVTDRLKMLARLGYRSRAFLRHVYQKLAALTFGRLFVSRWGLRFRAAVAGARPPLPEPQLRVAIVAHAYYPDLIPEILACRDALPGTAPVHFTIPPERVAAAQTMLQGVDEISLHVCENRGRDIWPFLQLLGSGALDGYDAVLKLHTKRSPHLLDGDIRRRLLFAMLCGERRSTSRALSSFLDPRTGMVGWDASRRSATPYWMANRERVHAVARRMGGGATVPPLGFFEGSMFWFRPSAFAALRELRFSAEDFEAESGQVDGTLHHALERCFTVAAWLRGFAVRDLKGRLLEGL